MSNIKQFNSINGKVIRYAAKGAGIGAMAGAMGLACTGVLALGFVYNGRDSAESMRIQVMWMVMMCGGSGAVLGAGSGAVLGMILGAISGDSDSGQAAPPTPVIAAHSRVLPLGIIGAIIGLMVGNIIGAVIGGMLGGFAGWVIGTVDEGINAGIQSATGRKPRSIQVSWVIVGGLIGLVLGGMNIGLLGTILGWVGGGMVGAMASSWRGRAMPIETMTPNERDYQEDKLTLEKVVDKPKVAVTSQVAVTETPPVDNPVVIPEETFEVLTEISYSEATRLIRQEIETQRQKRGKVNLSWKTLLEVDLSECDLSGADLSYAKSQKANLRGANLRGTDLHGAKLNQADLRGADLTGANLEGADLREANLEGANLAETRTNWATQMDS